MSALVLKKWSASNQPVDQEGNYIAISGRQSGLISWLLSRAGVDPVTTIHVSAKRIVFSAASLAGSKTWSIPLHSVCSTQYGYHKPWGQALALWLLFMWLLGVLVSALWQMGSQPTAQSVGLLGTLVVTALAIAYFFFNRTVTFGFVENSGVLHGIQFKRSVIENVAVNEQEAKFAADLTMAIIERATTRRGSSRSQEHPKEAAAGDARDRSAPPPSVPEPEAQIGFSCPGCGRFFEGPSTMAGADYTCPECRVNFHIH